MRLNVYLNAFGLRRQIGILDSRGAEIRFQYHPDFVQEGIELSPFRLPLNKLVQMDTAHTFAGLHGLFNDSLPDGWGLLLLDRTLQRRGVRADNWPMQRLAVVGRHGMGSLEYEPEQEIAGAWSLSDLDTWATDSLHVLEEHESTAEKLDALLRLNGSSAGARPKVLVNITDTFTIDSCNTSEPWLIKFRTTHDSPDAGLEEYVYSLAARAAGLDMPPTHLFPSKISAGWFGVKRFDRVHGHKVHVHTACGLLHASHRHPSLDYENLLRLAMVLTSDVREVEKMARLMVFNVKAGNKDDHSKNFSFLLDAQNQWRMAPAYDLTPSQGIMGEQTCMVNGKGRDITDDDLIRAVAPVSLAAGKLREMIAQVEAALAHVEDWKNEVRKKQADGQQPS